MKVAVSVKENNINTEIDDRFGRAEYFLIKDMQTGNVEFVENGAKDDAGGAGGRAVRILSLNEANAVIVPELGPKAVSAMQAFEIKAYAKGDCIKAMDALEKYSNNELVEIDTATVEEHSGLRRA